MVLECELIIVIYAVQFDLLVIHLYSPSKTTGQGAMLFTSYIVCVMISSSTQISIQEANICEAMFVNM